MPSRTDSGNRNVSQLRCGRPDKVPFQMAGLAVINPWMGRFDTSGGVADYSVVPAKAETLAVPAFAGITDERADMALAAG